MGFKLVYTLVNRASSDLASNYMYIQTFDKEHIVNQSVDIGEKLVCMRFELLKKAY